MVDLSYVWYTFVRRSEQWSVEFLRSVLEFWTYWNFWVTIGCCSLFYSATFWLNTNLNTISIIAKISWVKSRAGRDKCSWCCWTVESRWLIHCLQNNWLTKAKTAFPLKIQRVSINQYVVSPITDLTRGESILSAALSDARRMKKW